MKVLNIGFSNPAIKRIKELKKKTIDNFCVIEDLSIFDNLREDSKSLDLFIYCPSIINKKETLETVEYFKENSKEVYEVSEKVFIDLVDKENRAGLIGIYQINPLTISSLNPSKHKFVLVLDGIEIPGNMGTLFRSSDGVNVDLVVICNKVTNPLSSKVTQASRGMNLFKDIVICEYEEIQKYLLDNNYNIYLGEPELGKNYKEYDYSGNIALVVGNERFGIDQRWYNGTHNKVFIPMAGKMGCLNVSIAGSILMYEAFMKRNG